MPGIFGYSLGWMVGYWWIMLIESLAGLVIMGALSLAAPKIVGPEPRSLGKLKLSIYATLALTVIAYAALFMGLADLLGGQGSGVVVGAAILALIISLGQWLLSPVLINLAYHTRPPFSPEEKRAEAALARLAAVTGMRRPPRLVIVDTEAPNAFAYGSPLMGSYVAVTRGLLRIASPGELEAVLGHELGHLKHRDVAWILALSIIPLAVYIIGRSLVYAAFFSGGSRESERGSNSATLLLIGLALIVAGFLFKLIIAHFNRLREYYADAFSTLQFRRGRELQKALTKIYLYLTRDKGSAETLSRGIAYSLYIVAPLVEVSGGMLVEVPDSLVEAAKREEVNPLLELFSTHPPVPKRLRFIDRLMRGAGGA